MNDFTYQTTFVAAAVERLLTLLDNDSWSPTFGCAHPAYWRDKTVEMADMRRQELMLPLALLYRRDYPGSCWRGDARLLRAASALLAFWVRNRYDDGSMDEWYKGERAFAAAAFSTFAVARTLGLLAEHLEPDLLRRARRGLARTAGWLARRNDLFKSNHQAVGVAALAWAARQLDDPAWEVEARRKLSRLLATQTREGWFPELGHVDPGYTFLTVEYVGMALSLWQETGEGGNAMVRAMEFACGWVHPDLTLGDEYGVCHNPYLSRIAAILMTPRSPLAARLVDRWQERSSGFAGLASTLGDDLRLTRWAFQPLLAWDFLNGVEPGLKGIPLMPLPLPLEPGGKQKEAIFSEAGLIRLDIGSCRGVFAPVAGGLVRLFGPGGATLTDGGYVLAQDGCIINMFGYNRQRPMRHEPPCHEVTIFMAPVRKFFPSLTQRLILRLLCTTATGSRWTRNGIDWIRRRKATPINQSSANLKGGTSPWRVIRRVVPGIDEVEIQDHLLFDRPEAISQLSMITREDLEPWRTRPVLELFSRLPARTHALQVIKRWQWKCGRWQLAIIMDPKI
ncbi:MAG: hypothetical protein HQL81_16800 [Magnetococcales bacterium]|nr:hypothetical protein [Magnetococcales bacterium]